jgi:hypothetical protein
MPFEVRRRLARHEVRVLGPWLFALPAFVAMVFTLVLAMMGVRQAGHMDIGNMVMAGIEGTVPLVAGIAVATIVSVEPALELQLAVLVPYRRTVLRRIALLLLWSSIIEVLSVALVSAVWPWALPSKGLPGYLLIWLAPLLWFSAWGAILALLLRSRAASVAILGVVWAVELLFHAALSAYGWTRAVYVFATMFDSASSYWGVNRLELLLTAVVIFGGVWLYLRDGEARLQMEEV